MRIINLILLIFLISACSADKNSNSSRPVQSSEQAGRNIDWPAYLGDNGRQHYSNLSQITPENVAKLKVAWRYDSGELRGKNSTMYTSPLVIDGVLYGLSPKLVAFALNAATGEEIWRSDLGLSGAAQRGLMWWEKGEDKRVLFSAGRDLYAINAADGKPVPGFGDNGKVDMSLDGTRAYLGVTVPGVVFEDKIILGFSTTEGTDSAPGAVRAFSAIDGKLVWQFNTIPAPGEPGSETWAEGSYERAGGANVWTGFTMDNDRGVLFVPTGSATPDFYGANRLGDNLYANCLLAIDARTGKLKWHYQVIKHDLWDRDNPSPPTLVQLNRDGRRIDAVTLTTKGGHLYAFDRDTGESLYPLIEIKTPILSTIPGEQPASSQFISSVQISKQTFEITRRSKEATQFVQEQIKDFDMRPWAPPKVGTVLITPWYDGGAEWGGSAYDPVDDRLILNAHNGAGILNLTEVPIGSSNYSTYARNCGSCHGLKLEGSDAAPTLKDIVSRLGVSEVAKIISEGRGRMPAFEKLNTAERRAIFGYIMSPDQKQDEPSTEVDYILGGYVNLRDHEGLPGNAPPWGTLNSIDLATGEIVWKVNFGNYPTHPELGYGAFSYGGPVVTASGVIFIAATPDKKIHAYHKATGDLLWEADLPAAGYSTPAVYSVDGKQYVVIAAGGGRLGPPSSSEYVAYSLP